MSSKTCKPTDGVGDLFATISSGYNESKHGEDPEICGEDGNGSCDDYRQGGGQETHFPSVPI